MMRRVFYAIRWASWVIIPAIVIITGSLGCSEKEKGAGPPVYNKFQGFVSLNVVDIEGRPFPGIPVILEICNSIDPMVMPLDTVYTNEYGVAFLDAEVKSYRNADAGRIVIEIDGTEEAIDRYFVNGEQFYLIYRIFRSSVPR